MRLVTELRRRRKDNRLIVGLVLAVLVVWSVVSVLENRAREMEPVTITRGLLLFVLSYINITLIAAVLFVLCRVLLKTWLERRRDVLGSRFQTKLLVTYLGLTAIPIGLLFFTATGLLQRSIDRWFSTPVREVVLRARAVQDMAEKRIVDETDEKARALAALAADPADAPRLAEFRRRERLDSVEAYRGGRRVALDAETPAAVEPVPAESLLKAEANGREIKIEALPDASHRYRALIRAGDTVWSAGTRIGPPEARALDAITAAWSDYKKLEAQKPAIKAANISTFLLITLAILFASIWTGSTLARRITGPIAALADSTRGWASPPPMSSACSSSPSTGWRRACRRRATRSSDPTRNFSPRTGAWTWRSSSCPPSSRRSRRASWPSTRRAVSRSATPRRAPCSRSTAR
jgi:nitrogen fixation/metabolism regulation signal transduction histidine kinase